ncbi:dihydropyrimidinase [Pseudomonas aeruginosa]|nr:dihydropyrimidinase [Pseudomonas aeruginosa]RUH66101.1 dihydropyrimidinase [Pseudomonas aeruginosa]
MSNHGGATDQQGHAVFPRRLTGRCRFLKLFFRHAPRTFVILSAMTGFESRC